MSDQIHSAILLNEIVTSILIRLPAKSICRFKCVSKTWNSLICNPNFISSYISHTSSSPSSSSWVIVDRVIPYRTESEDQVTQFNLLEFPNISSLSVNPNRLVAEPITDTNRVRYPGIILSSSNGLLLISLFIKRDPHKEHKEDPNSYSSLTVEDALFVVNPITGEWVGVPRARKHVNNRPSVGFITRVDSFGVVEKFVVAEYCHGLKFDFSTLMASMHCFSSDTGKWVEFGADYKLGLHFWRSDGVFEFGGRFFWADVSYGLMAWEEDPFCCMEKKGKALCRLIPLPSELRKPYNTPGLEKERSIRGSGGYIQYVEVFKKGNYVLKVWRLRDLGSCGEEWSLVYNVFRVDVKSCLAFLKSMPRPCFHHPFEADIIFFETGNRMFSYNFQTKKAETCASFTGYQFVLSYVLPSWPTSLPPRLYAVCAKEKGNEFFSDQNYTEAIESYSRSIALLPNTFAYANRALAYIKVSRFHEAEDDCTEALKLDSEYFKAYGRRAIARKELGNFEGSLDDLEFALKLQPKNQELNKQHAEIISLLEKASVKGCSDDGRATCDVHMEDKQCTG